MKNSTDDPGGRELEEALDIVCITYIREEKEVKPPSKVIDSFGRPLAFTDNEVKQLRSLSDLISHYIEQRSSPRPLCLAVFGPPGSGKSFAVKEIRKAVEGKLKEAKPKLRLPFTLINLTQVSGSIEVGRVLARIAGEQDDDTVPIVFFDEFDAPRDSAPYGWLKWFLAPMHDGEFLHEGATIRLKRAVYVFAGGTADTLDKFSRPRSVSSFRAAKGPDFVSRLRGYLDVQGPNAEHWTLRRAIVFNKEIQDRVVRGGPDKITPDRELMTALLQVGRYRHGARSIGAIVELSDFSQNCFDWPQLPEDHLLALHIDRGPLDSALIHGFVALSGYSSAKPDDARGTLDLDSPAKLMQWSYSPAKPDDASGIQHSALLACWLNLSRELWRHGATLSFAGSWRDGEHGLMSQLAEDLKRLSVEPSPSQKRRDNPRPWLVSFLNEYPTKGRPSEVGRIFEKPEDQDRFGLHIVPTEYVPQKEREALGDAWSALVVDRFRRRLAQSESSVARFALGGSTQGHGGRIPGIAEELMLTLALNKPVYVAGGFEGAAQGVGQLLGLGRHRTGEAPSFMKAEPDESRVDALADKLRPGPWTDLPVTAAGFVSFFKAHAIGGPKWPDNGLSTDDNRLLFATTDAKTIARLVLQGLRRRFEEGLEGL